MARSQTDGTVTVSRKRWHLAAIVIGGLPTLLSLFEWVPAWRAAASAGQSHPVYPLVVSLAGSLFLAVGVEALGYLSELRSLATNLATVSPLFARVHALADARPYAGLLDQHTALNNLSGTFTVALDQLVRSLRRDGLVVVSASNGDYLEVLESALHHSKRSFEAVLTTPYTPWWFFVGEPGLRSADKLDYLRCVLAAKGIGVRARLLVYNWTAPSVAQQNGDQDDANADSFQDEFIAHIDSVEQYLEAAGQYKECDGVRHYLFDWSAYKKVEADHRPQHRKLFHAVDRVLENRLDFALIDDRLVVQKRTDTGLQVIPLGHEEDRHYRDIFEEFRRSRVDGGAWWIPLNREYLAACRLNRQLLSYSDYDEQKDQTAESPIGDSRPVGRATAAAEADGSEQATLAPSPASGQATALSPSESKSQKNSASVGDAPVSSDRDSESETPTEAER